MYANYMAHGPPKRTSVLRFTPPGLTYPLDIPFPGRVLPVCARCKKNYKTREHCRTKEGHTGLPWTDTYICITLDNTCFAPDGSVINGTFHAQGVQSNPYVYPEHITLDPKTPSCAQCKDKNYTRTYCRMSKKHKTLPWSTVYVTLTLARGPGAGVEASAGGSVPLPASTTANSSNGDGTGESDKNGNADESTTSGGNESAAKKMKKNDGEAADVPATPSEETGPVKKEEKKEDDEDDLKGKKSPNDTAADAEKSSEKKEDGDDAEKETEGNTKDVDIFKNPHPSRTFLSTVSVSKNEIQWVDLDQGAAALMQHRNAKPDGAGMDGSEVAQHGMYAPHSPYQIGMHAAMGMGMGMHHMGYPPGMPQVSAGGVKDDPNRAQTGSDGQHNQWGMNSHGGMPPGQYPGPDMMYNQMMDPRMGGYGGFQPGWRGGYPMDMGMQGMQGGQPGQMGQMPPPYDGGGHMLQQMTPSGWGGGGGVGGGHPGMGQQGLGQGDMPQSMPPGVSPNGMLGQGMMPQSNSPQGMSRQMHQGGMPPSDPAMGGGPHDMKGGGGPMPGGPDPSQDPKANGSSETLQI